MHELVRDALPVGVSVQDLGEHALKDLLRPERVFQLTGPDLPGDFPALKSLSRHTHNLPMQPTLWVSRKVLRAISQPVDEADNVPSTDEWEQDEQ